MRPSILKSACAAWMAVLFVGGTVPAQTLPMPKKVNSAKAKSSAKKKETAKALAPVDPGTQDILSDLSELNATDEAQGELSEKYIAVRSRDVPLGGRFEFMLNGGKVVQGDGFLDTSEAGGAISYHFTDRWSFEIAKSQVQNKFTKAANDLEAASGFLPFVDYAKSHSEAKIVLRGLYGKFRITRNQALLFDQYLSLGPSQHQLNSGDVSGLTGELGLAFWPADHLSFRMGLKDHYYKEGVGDLAADAHHTQVYASLGYLL